MKISSKGRYAVSAMIDLAMHEKKGPLTIADISEKQNISLSYLEQIFAELRKAGLVRGTRGPGGGYRLACSADEITVAKVMEALGERRQNVNLMGDRYVPFEMWKGLSQQIYDFLSNITLQQCIDRVSQEQSTVSTTTEVFQKEA
ncbi:MAG: Rrf2 family transcriptional regulator, partial [Gammaproteobacteria bacterium]|nr:Rrf2 family transcriptional regulator [Gammaproteobacteria bacterium]